MSLNRISIVRPSNAKNVQTQIVMKNSSSFTLAFSWKHVGCHAYIEPYKPAKLRGKWFWKNAKLLHKIQFHFLCPNGRCNINKQGVEGGGGNDRKYVILVVKITKMTLMLLCPNFHNDLSPALQRNGVSMAAIRGAVRPSIKRGLEV